MSNLAYLPSISDQRQSFEGYWEECQEIGAFIDRREAYRLYHMSPEQYFANAGWVYVLSNPLMTSSTYKIGRTTGKIERRMRQLYTTGVPVEFECVYAGWFADCITAESVVHDLLADFRISDSREFFAASLKAITNAIKTCSVLGEMHPDHMIDLAYARYKYAVDHEKVKGVLVAKKQRLPDMEVPF